MKSKTRFLNNGSSPDGEKNKGSSTNYIQQVKAKAKAETKTKFKVKIKGNGCTEVLKKCPFGRRHPLIPRMDTKRKN